MKKILPLIISIFMLLAPVTSIFADQPASNGVPQLGLASDVFMHLFGLEGNEKVGTLVVSEPVGERDPLVWGAAAEYPWIESLIFMFDPDTMEYRYASYSPSTDVILKIHSQQPYDYSISGFEKYEDQIQWIDLEEQYVMLDVYPYLQVQSGYYAELTEVFDALEAAKAEADADAEEAKVALAAAIAERNDFQAKVDAGQSEYEDELEASKADVEAKGLALLTAISEKDAAEIEIEKLQDMVRERDGTIAGQDAEIAELEAAIAASKAIEDPYLVRQSNLDRKGATPYFELEGAVSALPESTIADGLATIGVKMTNSKTGRSYVLLEGFGGGNTDGEWVAGGLVVLSLPQRILEFNLSSKAGTEGAETYIYEGMDGEFYGIINASAQLNIPYEDTVRFGIEGGVESSLTDDSTAYFVNFDFEATPANFQYMTFVVDQLSFADVQAANGDHLQKYKASAGFDINWSAGHDKDPAWVGDTYTWFVRFNYQIEDNKTNLTVNDQFGAQFGLRILFGNEQKEK